MVLLCVNGVARVNGVVCVVCLREARRAEAAVVGGGACGGGDAPEEEHHGAACSCESGL